jgi:hypothetical protein
VSVRIELDPGIRQGGSDMSWKCCLGGKKKDPEPLNKKKRDFYLDDLRVEVRLMARFASRNSLPVRAELMETVVKVDCTFKDEESLSRYCKGEDAPSLQEAVKSLTQVHKELTEIVSPATPRSIFEVYQEGVPPERRSWPNSKKLFFWLLGLAVVSLVVYIGLVSHLDKIKNNILCQHLLMVVSASLGASLYSLFSLHQHIRDMTFDSKYIIKYITRFTLGVIAGYVLAAFFADQVGKDGASAFGEKFKISYTSIALLGGYSAEAVNKILKRFVEMIVTMVQGGAEHAVKVREKEFEAVLKQIEIENKTQMLLKFSELRKQIDDPEIQKKLDAFLQESV